MEYVREVPFVPVKGSSISLNDFKELVTRHQVVECDKVSKLKKERKLLVGSYYKEIVDWMINNPESFEIVKDFSGYDFGVEIEERLGRVYFRSPLLFDEEIYQGFNARQFYNMGIEEKLSFIRNGCNYIPVKIIEEKFYVDNLSHMWSHIKLDKDLMKDLDKYMQTSKFAPRFQVFYFIRYDAERDMVYLKRDYSESPRDEEVTEYKVELPPQIDGSYIKRQSKVEESTEEGQEVESNDEAQAATEKEEVVETVGDVKKESSETQEVKEEVITEEIKEQINNLGDKVDVGD